MAPSSAFPTLRRDRRRSRPNRFDAASQLHQSLNKNGKRGSCTAFRQRNSVSICCQALSCSLRIQFFRALKTPTSRASRSCSKRWSSPHRASVLPRGRRTRLRDEILSACALNFIPLSRFTIGQRAQLQGQFACSNANSLIPFNVDQTRRLGLEAGVKTRPLVDLFAPNDHIFLDTVWTFIDSHYVDDPTYGNSRLPFTPRNQAFAELGYRHPAGFYVSGNLRFTSNRWTTFDNSGGDAFLVPSYTLYGAKIGWRAPDQSWSLWAEARNLTDVAYVGDFSPILRSANAVNPTGTPLVYPGTGRGFYAGFTKRFN